MTNVESLSELMLAYIDGDSAAFARLYARLRPVLTRRVSLLVTEPAAVDDIVQTSFLRAHAARERFVLPADRDPDASVLAWYSTVAGCPRAVVIVMPSCVPRTTLSSPRDRQHPKKHTWRVKPQP